MKHWKDVTEEDIYRAISKLEEEGVEFDLKKILEERGFMFLSDKHYEECIKRWGL